MGPVCSGKTKYVKDFVKSNKGFIVLNPSDLSRAWFGNISEQNKSEFKQIFYNLVLDIALTYENIIIDGLMHDLGYLDCILNIIKWDTIRIKTFCSTKPLSVVRNESRPDQENKWSLHETVQSIDSFMKMALDPRMQRFEKYVTIVNSEVMYSIF